jgi:hypothetical protein
MPAAFVVRGLSYVALFVLSATLVESSVPGYVGDWVFAASPYVSLVISASFVAVDTQMLAARAASVVQQPRTNKDAVKDAIMIFLDSVDVFRKVSAVCKLRFRQKL